MSAVPTVSVVIPTVGREEVAIAVQSALDQTHAVHEVLVMADTADEFEVPADPRVRIIRVGPRAGGNVARQTGVEQATGELVALLDDDDAWLPGRIQTQLAAVAAAGPTDDGWFATSRVLMRRSEEVQFPYPAVAYESSESIARYLFLKRTPRSSHGFIQASTLLFPRSLALRVPFDTSLRFHQDISWLIDVQRTVPRVLVVQVWEPLVVYNWVEGSVSKKISANDSIAWARGRLSDDKRALGEFILSQSFNFARRTRSTKAMLDVIASAVRVGRPGPAALIYSLGATAKTSLGIS
ncbi:glycosyltransferase family 2 protein [Rathayibacter sp. YIM 133350]|uniref:glycosyltransferase family 2 protein n=1 Tax=Rathayibacter sp. YIM 133350 TaxID=3131992 RepID=UPI00307D3EA0